MLKQNKYKLRRARNQDISDIMKIEKSCFEKDICESKETFLERINTFPEGFYVMTLNNRVIGYLSTEIWTYFENINNNNFTLGHSIEDLHNINDSELYISSMGLLPAFQGKGLGKLLFENTINYITNNYRNISSIILVVSENWTSAIQIYNNNGFQKLGIINNFFIYSDKKENAIIMRKYL